MVSATGVCSVDVRMLCMVLVIRECHFSFLAWVCTDCVACQGMQSVWKAALPNVVEGCWIDRGIHIAEQIE